MNIDVIAGNYKQTNNINYLINVALRSIRDAIKKNTYYYNNNKLCIIACK